MRDELLGVELFSTLYEAQVLVEDWRIVRDTATRDERWYRQSGAASGFNARSRRAQALPDLRSQDEDAYAFRAYASPNVRGRCVALIPSASSATSAR